MGIDDISVAIGALQADAVASQRQRSDLFKKTGEIKDNIAELKVLMTQHITSTVDALETQGKAIEGLQSGVSGLKKFRQRVYIILAGVGGSGGISGWLAGKLIGGG